MSHAIAVQRRQLAHHVRDAAGDRAGGFAAALASGDRSFMSIADQDALRGAGLAHLLAISGLHMGIVGGLVFLLIWRGLSLIEPLALRGSVKKPAAAAALLACFAYLVISGASVSTQRAFIMAAVLFGAVLIDRTALSLRSLSIAMILILAMAPWSVLSPGFQMSFAATGALIASYERWQRRRRASAVPRRSQYVFWLQSLVVTSTVSSFATMPFALYHFSRVAGLGLIANLIAMPLVSLISAPSAAAALLLAPVGQDAWALRLFGLSLEAVLAVAHYFSQALPDRTLMFPAMPASCLALFTGAILFFCLLRSARAAWISSTLIAALSVLVWANAGIDRVHWAPSGEVFLEHKSGRVERIELIKGEGLGPLRFADLDVTRKCPAGAPCQMRLGPAQIGYDASAQALEITHVLSPSSTVLTWSEVSAENGISVELRGATIRRIEKLACGHRPWRSC
ncbi:MAG: ComEC/Rec2 family competence protein [Hyphomonadaceae bacterium]|nr:ComEC/Rec2 family competence protein [Hyphomonadaceae bacterium]